MSIFILFALIMINGEPYADYDTFDSMTACQEAKTEAVQSAIQANITEGSFTCTEVKVGKLS